MLLGLESVRPACHRPRRRGTSAGPSSGRMRNPTRAGPAAFPRAQAVTRADPL